MERDLREYLDKWDAAEAENEESVYLYDSAYDEGYADGYKYAVDEFAEKLILRLEKEQQSYFKTFLEYGMNTDLGRENGLKESIKIVNEIAKCMKVGGNNEY